MSQRLQNGQRFPALELTALGGGVLKLPDDLAGTYGVILIYRGYWCPFCNEQIASFADATEMLAEAGIAVVAFSVDDEAATSSFAEKHGLRFRLGYSADLAAVAEATGAYDTRHPVRGHFLETTGFVLAPDGSVVCAVYSSRAIGRLLPGDVMRLVAFTRSKAG